MWARIRRTSRVPKRFSRTGAYLRKFYTAVSLIFSTLASGITGFMLIEKMSLGEAVYMTIITVSTVGFGEVRPLSEAGRVFVSILIVFNIGIFAYAISTLSNFIIEGELRLFLKDFSVYKKIQQLNDHIIVCGYGKHGQQVAEELRNNNYDFVILENNPARIEELRSLGTLFLEGDATHDETLEEANIQAAAGMIITFGEDAENVYTVITARQLNPRIRIITRAIDQRSERKLRRAGADEVVRPERLGGFYMATLISQPNVVEFFNIISNLGSVSIHFREFEVSALANRHRHRSILDLNIRSETGANIIGLRRVDGKYIVNPHPTTALQEGMRIVVLGDGAQMQAFEKLMVSD